MIFYTERKWEGNPPEINLAFQLVKKYASSINFPTSFLIAKKASYNSSHLDVHNLIANYFKCFLHGDRWHKSNSTYWSH